MKFGHGFHAGFPANTSRACTGLVPCLQPDADGRTEDGTDSRGVGERYLGLGEAEAAGQLLALGAHHVVVLLEGPLQAQELRRREGGTDALGFPGEGAVQEQALLGHLAACRERVESGA